MQGINNSDLGCLLDLYDAEAVLIPTFSNRVFNKPDKFREYFEKLGSRTELGIALHEKALLAHNLQDQVYALGGIYN